ncbi:uncharacterized protein LOC123327121 [Drosophila simulans]|uniref:uncharacterized protein LOC123327121 n=1 Tax=Drosophila simulans TaxID=7240 RepID=UPI001D100D2F|nr:uncharacterized protein LOC123327121 [Drosophila simulans]
MSNRPNNFKIPQALTAGNVARHYVDRLLDGERPTSVVTPKKAPKRSAPTAQARPVAGGKYRAATPSHSNVVKAGQAGRAKNQLPQLGQPGARDNPNRKGLSGARTKWYLRYLQQGKSPAEALSLAKTPQPLEQKPNSASKRANTTLTPPTETPKRQKVEKSRQLTALFDGPNTSRTAKATEVRKPSYATVTGAIKVAVVPEGYPKVILSSENLSQLEEIVLSGWDSPIKIGGIHFRVGHLIVDCRNATTAEWLQSAVPSLSKWSGVSLEVRMGDDLPSSHNITVFCPRTGDKITKWIMELIKKPNDLDTDNRRLISRKNEGGGSLLSLGIDDNSCAKIISSDHKLSFRFGDISDLADDEDLDATIIERGDQTTLSSQELGMELDLLSKEEAIPVDGDLGISRSATPTMKPII